MNVPETVGVPLMVIVPADQAAFTPAGNPDAAPMPVAPVVVCVILERVVLVHKEGAADAGVTELEVATVRIPVAVTVPHPPVSVTV